MNKNIIGVYKTNVVAVVTHDDLDGHASYRAIVEFLGSPKHVVLDDYNPESSKTYELIKEALEKQPDTEVVFILDRDINDFHLSKLIEKHPNLQFIHIDHHQNNKHFSVKNTIGYYGVNPNEYNKAAAELCVEFCEMFMEDSRSISKETWNNLKEIILHVGDWDTFRWKSLLGYRKEMANMFLAAEKINGGEVSFNKFKEYNYKLTDEVILFLKDARKTYSDKLEQEIEKTKANMRMMLINDIRIAVATNVDSSYFSLVASRINDELNTNFIVNIYSSGLVSFRGHNKHNTKNLGYLASLLPGKGGGHFNSAGGKLVEKLYDYSKENEAPKEHIDKLLDSISEFLEENI